jgi:hypothetical protein
MHRLQVMIPEEQHAWLKERARVEGKSIGQFVREALEKLRGDAALPDLEDDPLSEMVGMFRGGLPRDVSVRHDEVIYLDP